MKMKSWKSHTAVVVCFCIANLQILQAQEPSPPKYKLTIAENAATSKRVKKGRVSSQAVVIVTDENDVPVPGIAVTFTLPQLTGGASFAKGGLTSVTTTNASGQASSGSFTAPAGSSFSVGVTASVSGTALSIAVPVAATSAAIAAAGGGGVSIFVILGVVAAVGVAGALVAVKLLGGKSSPQGTIGTPTGVSIGQP
jgi:hypothetical protein